MYFRDSLEVYFQKGLGEYDLDSLKGKTGFRLHTFPEGGGKVRIIGIGNTLTQGLLFPIHSAIFSWLRRNTDDYTFDQSRIRYSYQRWQMEKREMFSLDLSAATDRIPVIVQLACLCNTLGYYTFILGYLMTWSCKFRTHGSHYLTYSVGQPMGLYGSWGLLALSHHMLVRFSANRIGRSARGLYGVLGDDVVIADRAISDSYQYVMSSLGVSIQPLKSVVPGEVSPGRKWHGCEFASKLFTPRGEASPLATGTFLRESPIEILKLMLEGTLTLEQGDIRRFPWPLVDYFLIRKKAKIRNVTPDKELRSVFFSRSTDHVLREIRKELLSRLRVDLTKVDWTLFQGPPLFKKWTSGSVISLVHDMFMFLDNTNMDPTDVNDLDLIIDFSLLVAQLIGLSTACSDLTVKSRRVPQPVVSPSYTRLLISMSRSIYRSSGLKLTPALDRSIRKDIRSFMQVGSKSLL
uniref:RdRp n=1 Tax=Calvadosia cruxmelitensis mitovirus 1 TaxID=2950716 RepID=A0A9N7AAX9_9VIRU|nr:TPA_asm: RdRp [Calvadosia cruxmelitensis mitovirus 1]